MPDRPERIRAPYNFVPVSEHVYVPKSSELGLLSQDTPFEDGVCGELTFELTAETPIFVRGTGNSFFKTPDQKYAIPGTTLRGVLRNVLEIASFSRMSRVNDHTYGVRDLQNQELYIRHMSALMKRTDLRQVPMPLVTAGWMRKLSDSERVIESSDEPIVAEIVACDFAKVSYDLLLGYASKQGIQGFNPGIRQSGPNKYRTWGKKLDVPVSYQWWREAGWKETEGTQKRKVYCPKRFGAVTMLNGTSKGRIVFTGQPQRWERDRPPGKKGSAKHHDFVFELPPNQAPKNAIPVPASVFKAFEFVHSDRGQQNRLNSSANEEWKYWKETAFDRGEWVPVFFLLEESGNSQEMKLRAIGLAMMFRLAYRHSVKDGLPESHRIVAGPDLADCIFGWVRSSTEPEDRACKTRVSVGLAIATREVTPLREITAVLGSPKASYYPNYIEQSPAEDWETNPGALPRPGRTQPDWNTYMKDVFRLRGWKRYRPKQSADMTPFIPPNIKSEKVHTKFCPLPAGTVFRGKVRFHNLRKYELGALLWALDFGGDREARHMVGMARSLGFGRARFTLAAHTIEDTEEHQISAEECRNSFVQEMEDWGKEVGLEGGWQGSMQLYQLLACARPIPEGSDEGRNMFLDDPVRGNEFVEAKKAGLVLLPAGSVADWRRTTPKRQASAIPQSKVQTPPKEAPEERQNREEQDLFRRAFQEGKHGEILEKWRLEGGPRAAIRRRLAMEILVNISRKMETKYPEIVRWLKDK